MGTIYNPLMNLLSDLSLASKRDRHRGSADPRTRRGLATFSVSLSNLDLMMRCKCLTRFIIFFSILMTVPSKIGHAKTRKTECLERIESGAPPLRSRKLHASRPENIHDVCCVVAQVLLGNHARNHDSPVGGLQQLHRCPFLEYPGNVGD